MRTRDREGKDVRGDNQESKCNKEKSHKKSTGVRRIAPKKEKIHLQFSKLFSSLAGYILYKSIFSL